MLLSFLLACSWLSEPMDAQTAAVVTQGGSTAKERLDATRVSADLAVIRASIKQYRQIHEGENPPDIAALELTGLSFPERYAYDPASGSVTDPELPNL